MERHGRQICSAGGDLSNLQRRADHNVLLRPDQKALEHLAHLEYSSQLLFTNNRSTDVSLAHINTIRATHNLVGSLTLPAGLEVECHRL